MIRLDSTRSLQALLGGAVATTELPITVSYSDKTTDTYNGAAQLATTTGVTPVIIAAAPAAGVTRDIDYISARNVDTAPVTITIRYSTPHIVVTVLLAVGDHMVFVHGDGWRVFDAGGSLKTVLAMDHGTLTGLGDDDHPQYVLHTEVDDVPVNGATTDPISSNWAFDHEAAADPHPQYLTAAEGDVLFLTQAEGNAAYDALGAAAGAVAAHEGAVDPHTQYLTAAEGDALFLTPAEGNALYASISEPIAAAHIIDAADAHDASAISILDAADDFTATNVEDALAELQSDAEADTQALADHIADTADAHDASAISILDTANDFTATNVEDALAELQSDAEAHVAAADPHPGYVLESLIDAKGDLLIGTAADTIARRAAPANGSLLLADSSQTSGWIDSESAAARKNVIIGGDFSTNPWQRGTSFVSVATSAYTADRFVWRVTGAAVVDISKSADAPSVAQAGRLVTHCVLVDTTTADASIAAGDLGALQTIVEGYNFIPLAQKPMMLSFWHKHTKTGTYCIALTNSAADRSYVAEYTQAVSDTWELATISISASPAAGTWDYVNGLGVAVTFAIAMGSTYHTTPGSWQTGTFLSTANQVNGLDSASNNFRIALVQLEPGSIATAFEQRTVQEELTLCQRYYQILGRGGAGGWASAAQVQLGYVFHPLLRADPTLTLLTSTASVTEIGISNRTASGGTLAAGSAGTTRGAQIVLEGFSSSTIGSGATALTDSIVSASAEL